RDLIVTGVQTCALPILCTLKVIRAPRLEGRRWPPCPQYRRPWHRATGRRSGGRALAEWARARPSRRGVAPVCRRCCRCQGREKRSEERRVGKEIGGQVV